VVHYVLSTRLLQASVSFIGLQPLVGCGEHVPVHIPPLQCTLSCPAILAMMHSPNFDTHTTCPKYHCFFRTTLGIVEEAFCCFDASADGYLEREEVEHALTTTSTPGR